MNFKYYGFIEPFISTFFKEVERCFTLLGWLRCLFKKCHFFQTQLFVDIYVLLWLALELIVFYFHRSSQSICVGFLFLFSWRILDIVQSWYNVTIRPPYFLASPIRLLILVILNLIEMIFIFTIISFSIFPKLFSFNIDNALIYSISVIVPTISAQSILPRTCIGNAIHYGEVVIGLIFLIVIIHRTLSLFRQ